MKDVDDWGKNVTDTGSTLYYLFTFVWGWSALMVAYLPQENAKCIS